MGLIRKRVSLLLKSIKKMANKTFSMGRHLRRTPVPVWIHVACSAGDAAWSTSCFWSLKPSDCYIFKSWWAWVILGKMGLIGRSLLWPLVAMVQSDIIECPSLLLAWVATGWLCQCTCCYFGSLTTMKLFNMASPKFGVWRMLMSTLQTLQKVEDGVHE
jgi:hypothetical protein